MAIAGKLNLANRFGFNSGYLWGSFGETHASLVSRLQLMAKMREKLA
jgi:hypothetical protein